MSLDKIDKFLSSNNKAQNKTKQIEEIKSQIYIATNVKVKIRLRPPKTIVLICGSSSAASELNSQHDAILKIIKSIDQKIEILIINIK